MSFTQHFSCSRCSRIRVFVPRKNVKHIATIAVDNVLEVAEQREDFSMDDEDFKAFADYHLHICEKREMVGNSSHLL